jgi:hypothetical protein
LAVVTGDLGRRKTDSVREKGLSPDVSEESGLGGVILAGLSPTMGSDATALARTFPKASTLLGEASPCSFVPPAEKLLEVDPERAILCPVDLIR